MAGEINATNVVISNGSGVVGQGAATLTFGGAPIDISNKSNGDYITLLDGELAGKQLVFAVELTYNSDTTFKKVRADAIAGTLDDYTIEYPGSGAVTDELFAGSFQPNGMSDNLGHGEAVKTSITFSSSGSFTHTPAADV